ncbi:MAG: hypothetical protein ACERKZ_13105 [Lachnotalea sp.]
MRITTLKNRMDEVLTLVSLEKEANKILNTFLYGCYSNEGKEKSKKF